MRHICYPGKRTEDFTNLTAGTKTMIIRGVRYKNAPYECVFPGDIIYFSKGKDNILLSAVVESVNNIKKPKPRELKEILDKNEDALLLDPGRRKKLGKCRYFVLITLGPVIGVKKPELGEIIYEDEGFWTIAGDPVDKKTKNKGIGISFGIR